MPNPRDTSATNEHPALAGLRQLARNDELLSSQQANWRLGDIDEATVKNAAVLILFGVLDLEPAETPLVGADSMFSEKSPAVSSDLDVLIVVRASTLRKHAGQPAFPGGKVDPEDFERAAQEHLPVSYIAALREAQEETGLDPAGVEVLGEFNEVGLPVSNFMVTPVLGWWNKPTEVAAQDSNESALVLRVPVADLINPKNRHMACVGNGRTLHKSPAFTVKGPTKDFVIWGFTGILLDRIFTALGWDEPWDRDDRRPAPGFDRR